MNTETPKPASNLPNQKFWSTYRRILGYLKPYWLPFVASLLGWFLFSLCAAALADILQFIVDAVGVYGGQARTEAQKEINTVSGTVIHQQIGQGIVSGLVLSMTPDADLESLRIAIPATIGIIVIFRGIGFFAGSYFITYVSRWIVHDLRMELFAKLLSLPASYYDQTMAGHLVSKFTYNVERITDAVTEAFKVVGREGFVVIVLLTYLMYINWKLTLVFAMVAPIIGLSVAVISKRFRKLGTRIQRAIGEVTHVVQESVQGYRELRMFGGQEYERHRMHEASQNNRRQSMKLAVAQGINTPFVQLCIATAIGTLVWVILDVEFLQGMSSGQLVSYLSAAGMLAKPIRQLTEINSRLQQGMAAAADVFVMLDQASETDQGSYQQDRVKGKISFHKVNFSYAGSQKLALKDIELNIEAGETLALVGSSGSGKSTLVSLLPRFYDLAKPLSRKSLLEKPLPEKQLARNPASRHQELKHTKDKLGITGQSNSETENNKPKIELAEGKASKLEVAETFTTGQILIDDVPIENFSLSNLRSQIALVSQQVTLFNDTVFNNIAYGSMGKVSTSEVENAAKAAYAMDFIQQLPEGFNTLIGDNGVVLSGGQRQRLAIARAILKNAPILILDEATSALDTESERNIQAALDGLMQNRTSIVIAHRLSTIERVDRIAVMEQGRIIEVGNHQELLKAGGRYALLYQQQFANPIPDRS